MLVENRNDLKILLFLYENEIDAPVKARKATTIAKDEAIQFSDTKVRTTLNHYVSKGYVANGFKEGKADTYYLSDEGTDYVLQILEER